LAGESLARRQRGLRRPLESTVHPSPPTLAWTTSHWIRPPCSALAEMHPGNSRKRGAPLVTSTQSQTRTFDALTAAASIAQELQANAAYGEESGQLAPESVAALARSGMLNLWRPRSLGGLECDPVSYALAAEEVARADTAAAWLMHGVSATWFDLRLAQPELVDEIVASRKVPILGETFNKPMSAVATVVGTSSRVRLHSRVAASSRTGSDTRCWWRGAFFSPTIPGRLSRSRKTGTASA